MIDLEDCSAADAPTIAQVAPIACYAVEVARVAGSEPTVGEGIAVWPFKVCTTEKLPEQSILKTVPQPWAPSRFGTVVPQNSLALSPPLEAAPKRLPCRSRKRLPKGAYPSVPPVKVEDCLLAFGVEFVDNAAGSGRAVPGASGVRNAPGDRGAVEVAGFVALSGRRRRRIRRRRR